MQELDRSRNKKNISLEIEILIKLGNLFLSHNDFRNADTYFNSAARTIQKTQIHSANLDEVLGLRGYTLRQMKRYAESVELYAAAARAAKKSDKIFDYAKWLGKQGVIYRLMKKYQLAYDNLEKAKETFQSLGEKGRLGVAEQEGNIGLLASDRSDYPIAEQAYRKALDIFAESGQDDSIVTWATNLANVLTRTRRYHEAWQIYGKAMEASIRLNDEYTIFQTAEKWSWSYARSYQRQMAANVLLGVDEYVKDITLKVELKKQAFADLHYAGNWKSMYSIGCELLSMLSNGVNASKDEINHYKSLVVFAEKNVQNKNQEGYDSGNTNTLAILPDPPLEISDPQKQSLLTALDIFIIEKMAEYEESHNADGMLDIAHLICDVQFGLLNPTEANWKKVWTQSNLRYRIIGDTMKALCEQGMEQKSLEISQRFKSAGFCLPFIQTLLKNEMNINDELTQKYIGKLKVLSESVYNLQGPPRDDWLQRIERVRAAGELMLEDGELLRTRKSDTLYAKLGALVTPRDIFDAFPAGDPVTIVDLFVTAQGTVIHIIQRNGEDVNIIPVYGPNFNFDDVYLLFKDWIAGGVPHQITESQRSALISISKTLHDEIFCSLVHTLKKMRANQIILIPDPFTQFLPLHLAGICNREGEPNDDPSRKNTIDATKDGFTFFGEIYPIEYAPCLHAVAVSQHQKRPKKLSGILSLADSKFDLPAAANNAKWLAKFGSVIGHNIYTGSDATLTNLKSNFDKAHIIILGTHGSFNSAQPLESYLELYDRRWTMTDILASPFFQLNPVFILSACEVGAKNPGDNMAASGIPGALISSGCACVLASLWPVEDISMDYVTERFLAYLSHPGFRPSAALFRAIRDLKSLTKSEVVERCNGIISGVKAACITNSKLAEALLTLRIFRDKIDETEELHPFLSPQFWGGLVLVGSGWYAPAGAFVGGADYANKVIMNYQKFEEAKEKIRSKEYDNAIEILEEILKFADGKGRAKTLDLLAWAIWSNRKLGQEHSARKIALDYLAQASFLAQAEDDEQLIRNIHATKNKLELVKLN